MANKMSIQRIEYFIILMLSVFIIGPISGQFDFSRFEGKWKVQGSEQYE